MPSLADGVGEKSAGGWNTDRFGCKTAMSDYNSGTESGIDAHCKGFQITDLVDYDGDISLASKLDDGDDLVVVSSDVYQDAIQARNTLFMNNSLVSQSAKRGHGRPCIADFDDLTCLCDECVVERFDNTNE